MVNKNRQILFLCFFLIFLIIGIFIALNYFESRSYPKVTGKAVDIEHASVFTENAEESLIKITSPENKAYDFSNVYAFYTLDLNVSSNFDVDRWWYTLIDLTHSLTISENVFFTPNTTFNAVKWKNKLIVYARNSAGDIISDSVEFFVNAPNSAPTIEGLESEIFVCENSYLSYYFNVTDIDENKNGALESLIEPQNIFYVDPMSYWLSNGEKRAEFMIFSGNLSKENAGGINKGSKVYERRISINDGRYADSRKTNITVIEINNPPQIEDIPVQTKVLTGENSIFYYKVQVTDTEDGNQDFGNLGFNITILNSTESVDKLFNISSNGIINFNAEESRLGVYDISVCVNDRGIKKPHKNISLCGQDGKTKTSCKKFSLTVTNENKALTIVDHFPFNLSLKTNETNSLYFNITKYDPDGTIPDTYWYVDNQLKEYDKGNFTDEFVYSFDCGISGKHTVKVEITDGLLSDSIQWDLDARRIECPALSIGDKESCIEKWVCYDWSVCQNAKKSLEGRILSEEDYRVIEDYCFKNNWYEKDCGFQIRNCFTAKDCNRTLNKPLIIQSCFFTENPDCYDGIKNCHDGACEFLADCGGPCPSCPTCSDKIQNQGEERIDCEGPCTWTCEPEKPLVKRPLRGVLIILMIILALITTIKLFKIFEIEDQIKKSYFK